MKTLPRIATVSLFVLTSAACAGSEAPGEVTPATSSDGSSTSRPAELEAALHDVDLGENLPSAKATLEQALQRDAITGDVRDDAEISLAIAHKGLGDDERAISTLEALIARRGHSDWNRQQDVNRLLVRWLTGVDRLPSRPDSSALPVAAVARALAKTIPRTSKERVDVQMARFGGDETSEILGTFRLDGALRQEAEDECPLCERDLATQVSSRGYTDWTGILMETEHFAETLAVFYYDLEYGKIPARYDAYLPMPSAQIEERLRDGKGFYVVKERPGAPAVVLFAAPRRAQLASVESAFAELTELPKAAVSVNLPHGLSPREIKGNMRTQFGAFRACYDALPEPRPSGKVDLAFAIDGEGNVQKPSMADGTSIRQPAFTQCMLQAVQKVRFAALGGSRETTVRYPITFRPD